MKKLIFVLLFLPIICFAQTNNIASDGGNVVTKDADGNVDIVGNLTVSGDISGVYADAKFVRATDVTYSMDGTDWQIIDTWAWEGCAASGHNMIVDTTNNNVECESGYAGHYMVNGFITLSVDANSQNIFVGVGKNGNDPSTYAQAKVFTRQANQISNVSYVNMPTLAAGDSMSVYIKNADGDQEITVGRSNFVFELIHQD